MSQTGALSGTLCQSLMLLAAPRHSFAAADWTQAAGGYTVTVPGSQPLGVFRTAQDADPVSVLCDTAITAAGIVITAPAAFAGYANTL